MKHVMFNLVAGLAAILLFATITGRVLAVKYGRDNPTILNLNQRINAWWGLAGGLVAGIALGPIASILIFAFGSFFALREFITLTPTKASDHTPLFLAFFVAIPVQYTLLAVQWYGLFAVFIPVYMFFILAIASALSQDTDDFLGRNAKIHWAMTVCVYGLSHAPALLLLHIPGYEGRNALLLFYFLFVVQVSDVLQYVCGKLFGKRKLAPALSPSKTVEGLIGGGLLAALLGGLLHEITPFTFWQSFGMSVVIVALGSMGGLVLSAVKRSLGAKDWGQMISGHGGALDRLDSVCFAAPIFFHLTHWLFVP